MVGDTVPRFLKLPGKDSLPQETRMGIQLLLHPREPRGGSGQTWGLRSLV